MERVLKKCAKQKRYIEFQQKTKLQMDEERRELERETQELVDSMEKLWFPVIYREIKPLKKNYTCAFKEKKKRYDTIKIISPDEVKPRVQEIVQINKCRAKTKTGIPCKNNANQLYGNYCGIHKNQA